VLKLSGVTGASGAVYVTSGGGAVWVADGIFRIDPTSLSVAAGLDTAPNNDDGGLAVDDRAVWATDFNNNVVRRFDPHSGKLVASIAVDSPTGIVEADDGTLWVSSHHQGSVVHIDAATDKVIGSVVVAPAGVDGPSAVAIGDGSLWVDIPRTGSLVRLDERSGALLHTTAFHAFNPVGGIAVTPDSVWLSEGSTGTRIARVDPVSGAVLTMIDTQGNVAYLAADGSNLWFLAAPPTESSQVSTLLAAVLEEISDTGVVERKIQMGQGVGPGGVTVAYGAVWVTTVSAPVVVRIPL
jgi:streptogramin lyase